MDNHRSKAERFSVWRAGNRCNWDCDYHDLADITGIPVVQVKIICMAAGWRCHEQIPGVDREIDALFFQL